MVIWTVLASGQSLQVLPDTSNYLITGGTISYEVSISYPGTPNAVGLRVIVPSDWTYTSTSGLNAPTCLDAVGAKQAVATEGFGWFYFTAPVSPAKFTVKFTYPASQSGDKSVQFTALISDTTGPSISVSPSVAVPAVLPPLSPPVIGTQPLNATVLIGSPATFSVVASGSNPLTYQWSKSSKAIAGATDASYTIGSVVAGDSGAYAVAVTNSKGSATSTSATLVVGDGAKITTQPKDTVVASGATTSLSVVATSAVPLSYQWTFKGAVIADATSATYTISTASGANTGYYQVTIKNAFDSVGVKSSMVLVQVAPPATSASQQVVLTPDRGYTAGDPLKPLRITNTFTFPAASTALGWTVILPPGFSLASETSAASSKPGVGTTDRLDWAWDAGAVSSPIAFTYVLNVPGAATGIKSFYASAYVRISNETLEIIGTPDPLLVAPAGKPHSSDSDGDWKITVEELAQTIAIFNTIYGSQRTGAYRFVSGSGFAPDPSVAAGVVDPLHIHSADTNANGAIDLPELLQVIDLYNYRVGTERTGSYHWQADETGTGSDRYAPSP